jgi:serine/threonine-protein kinase
VVEECSSRPVALDAPPAERMSPPDQTLILPDSAAPSSRVQRTFSPGDTIAGIYRVERKIGEGGMSVVLAATHLPTGRIMAVKVLQSETASAEGAVARFWREARAVSRLTTPHVVRIFDVGMLADDTPYMAMELLEGETLAVRMHRERKLPLPAALDCFRQACDAVAAAHAIGVVHRDLKPENMFLSREGGREVLKVLDFGISKTMRATVSDDQQRLTKTTDVFGSPTYMSPEQLKASRDVDARTDVWSLGVLLHEMLAGAPPFEGRSVAEIFGAILYMDPRPLGEIRADVPKSVEAAVLRALRRDREERFASVEELLRAIEAPPAPVVEPAPPRRNLFVAAAAAFVIACLAAFFAARLLF